MTDYIDASGNSPDSKVDQEYSHQGSKSDDQCPEGKDNLESMFPCNHQTLRSSQDRWTRGIHRRSQPIEVMEMYRPQRDLHTHSLAEIQ